MFSVDAFSDCLAPDFIHPLIVIRKYPGRWLRLVSLSSPLCKH